MAEEINNGTVSFKWMLRKHTECERAQAHRQTEAQTFVSELKGCG